MGKIRIRLRSIVDGFKIIVTNRKFRKYGITAIIALGVGLAGMIINGRNTVDANEVQEGIASQIVRFHVLANSDSEEDQVLKLKVKEHIVAYMEEILRNAKDIESTRQLIQLHIDDIAVEAKRVIVEEGYYYAVSVNLEEAYFPIKTYGDITFPAGKYEALQIKIGEAEGKNWWCVIYPNLCFIDATHAVVAEAEKQKLKNVLTEEEYKAITGEVEVKVKFKIIEDILNLLECQDTLGQHSSDVISSGFEYL